MTKEAAGEHRYSNAWATSLGSTSRLIAGSVSMIFSTTSSSGMRWIRAWSAICPSTRGVLTYAGQIVFEVTPLGPPSRAMTLDNPSRPCFAATYALLNGEARSP